MNIYELYGRLSEVAQEKAESLEQTMELLRALKAGTVPLEDVQVDKQGWRVEKAVDVPSNVVRFPTPDESD